MASSSDLRHLVVLLSVICMCIALYIVVSGGPLVKKETFSSSFEQDIINNIELPLMEKKALASTIIMFNPQQNLYAYTRNAYDMYISNEASLTWKSRFQEYLNKAFDSYLANILSFSQTIVVFTEKNFQGHVIYIPLSSEKKVPYTIVDPLIYQKYIRWEPPAKVISLIVPKGKQLKFYFQNTDIEKKATTDGLIRELILPDIIRSIEVDNNV